MRYVILQIWLWLYMTTAKTTATYSTKFAHFLERKNQHIAGRILQRKQAAARGTAQAATVATAARDTAPQPAGVAEMPFAPLWAAFTPTAKAGAQPKPPRKQAAFAQAAHT